MHTSGTIDCRLVDKKNEWCTFSVARHYALVLTCCEKVKYADNP